MSSGRRCELPTLRRSDLASRSNARPAGQALEMQVDHPHLQQRPCVATSTHPCHPLRKLHRIHQAGLEPLPISRTAIEIGPIRSRLYNAGPLRIFINVPKVRQDGLLCSNQVLKESLLPMEADEGLGSYFLFKVSNRPTHGSSMTQPHKSVEVIWHYHQGPNVSPPGLCHLQDTEFRTLEKRSTIETA